MTDTSITQNVNGAIPARNAFADVSSTNAKPAPTHSYMLPSKVKFSYIDDGEEPHLLADDELYAEVMECGVPLLDMIAKIARGYQKGNPIALLSKAIATAACDNPRASILTGIGSLPAPLNFLFCLVGPSGLGKGITLDAPMSCASPLGGYRIATPASGEALIASFFETVPSADGKGTETVRHTDPVWATWAEIDHLAAKAGNINATLDAIMRSLFSGEAAGDSSITRMKAGIGCRVEKNSYRFVMFVGAQPDHAGVLMDDATGGTLQRLLWFPLVDSDAPETAAEIRAYRTQLEQLLGMPKDSLRYEPPTLNIWGPGKVSMSSDIEDLLLESRSKVIRRLEVVDPLRTHANNLRIRLAAIFAGWRAGHGNPALIDREAWWWAGCLMEISDRTRQDCKDAAGRAKDQMKADAGRGDAVRDDAREKEKERLRAEKVEKFFPELLDALDDIIGCSTWGGKSRTDPSKGGSLAEFRRGFASSKRDFVEPAMKILMDNGDAILVKDGVTDRYVRRVK